MESDLGPDQVLVLGWVRELDSVLVLATESVPDLDSMLEPDWNWKIERYRCLNHHIHSATIQELQQYN